MNYFEFVLLVFIRNKIKDGLDKNNGNLFFRKNEELLLERFVKKNN